MFVAVFIMAARTTAGDQSGWACLASRFADDDDSVLGPRPPERILLVGIGSTILDGAKIGKNVALNTTHLWDWDVLTIEDDVVLGANCVVIGHVGEFQLIPWASSRYSRREGWRTSSCSSSPAGARSPYIE